VKVRDIVLPAGIKILEPQPEVLVIKAAPTITEEEIKAMEESSKDADLSKIEVAGKKKEDEEAAAEGEVGAEEKTKGEKKAE
jgi:hypothetical protein